MAGLLSAGQLQQAIKASNYVVSFRLGLVEIPTLLQCVCSPRLLVVSAFDFRIV